MLMMKLSDTKKQEHHLEILKGAVPGLSKFLMGLQPRQALP